MDYRISTIRWMRSKLGTAITTMRKGQREEETFRKFDGFNFITTTRKIIVRQHEEETFRKFD